MRYIIFLTSVVTLLAACQPASETPSSQPSEVAEESLVLATVNGEPITQADVEFMIERTFSSADQLFFDETMQAKVLDSLIASKAMQQQVQQTLSAEELADIRNRTKAYEEELYVKAYLQQHASPEPVSSKMVQDYYQRYPEEFGGGESRQFEMLSTNGKPSESARDAILAEVTTVKADPAWQRFGSNNQLGLVYKQAKLLPGLFDPALERALNRLDEGETSDVVFVKGVPYLLRVTTVETLPAKPLAEVSAGIRKKLAAIQLKKAVKAASDDVVSQAQVVRK